jgi:hypothetical protein
MRPAIDRSNVDGATRLHQDPVAPLAECRNQVDGIRLCERLTAGHFHQLASIGFNLRQYLL